jgi:hypothetical protein
MINHIRQYKNAFPPQAVQPSYETTPKWHDLLMIKLAAFQARGGARMRFRVVEQRTAEYRILNIEC